MLSKYSSALKEEKIKKQNKKQKSAELNSKRIYICIYIYIYCICIYCICIYMYVYIYMYIYMYTIYTVYIIYTIYIIYNLYICIYFILYSYLNVTFSSETEKEIEIKRIIKSNLTHLNFI